MEQINLIIAEDLLRSNIGVEREMLRVDKFGLLMETPHKKTFESKMHNPYITTDFAESQLEIITPAFNNSQKVCDFLENLYDICANEFNDEFMFSSSMPGKFNKVNISNFGKDEIAIEKYKYREKIRQKYGNFRQLICGIHYNYSYSENLLKKLYLDKTIFYKEFKNNIYLKVSKKYMNYSWLIIYLFGASPYVFNSSLSIDKSQIIDFNKNNGVSFRNSPLGYTNNKESSLDFSSLESYIDSINDLINRNIISEYKELYSPIRIKSSKNDGKLDTIKKEGIEYIEIRNIDVNPYEKTGISKDGLDFLNLFMIFLLLDEDDTDYLLEDNSSYNNTIVSTKGLENVFLKKGNNMIGREEYSLEIINKMENINQKYDLGFEKTLDKYKDLIKDSRKTIAYNIKCDIEKYGYIEFFMNLSKKYKKDSYNKRYKLMGFEDMELSTQILIKEAITKGIKVEILDKKDNFIALSNFLDKTEYVKQATKTSKDNYTTVLAMENKTVTKKILSKANIRVPRGLEFNSYKDAVDNISLFAGQNIVIKPKSTNFGKGITIINQSEEEDIVNNEDNIKKALVKAFSYDESVIVEEFIKGNEYRFLVIDDEVCGILRRVPANVIGDGNKNIKELIFEKNKNPLRQEGYTSPLEKIKIDDIVMYYLKCMHKDLSYIPQKDEVVYLRENSNISTGGDSIDYTDKIPNKYKDIAVLSAKAIGARICGVDMIIEDFEDEQSMYAIIELNFNPAIHIHCYPYIGEERNIGVKILKLLDLI